MTTPRILHQADVQALIDASISGQDVRSGVVTLVAGAATVLDESVTANSIIRLTSKTLGGAPGALYVSAKTPDTSFVITSTSATDTSVVHWEVLSD